MALMSGKNGHEIMCLQKEELQALCQLIPKLKSTFRTYSKV